MDEAEGTEEMQAQVVSCIEPMERATAVRDGLTQQNEDLMLLPHLADYICQVRIFEELGRYEDALILARDNRKSGWVYDWDTIIKRLRDKITNS